MRALVVERYGGPEVARIGEVPEPSPGRADLLVDVHAATVTSGDARMRAARFPPGMGIPARLALGWSGPRRSVFGVECAGIVREVGPGVDRFAVGDRVVALVGMALGGHAERCVVASGGCVAKIPDGVDFAHAVALPFGGTTAQTFLRRAAVRAGERVLVIGASGAVGVACVQVARRLGAHVTGVCSGANADLVRSLGAEEVVDYGRGPPTGQWDVVVDTLGVARLGDLRGLLAPDGRLALIAAGLPQMLAGLVVGLTSRQRVLTGVAQDRAADLEELLRWHAAGEYRAVIDAVYLLEQGRDAYARVDSGRKRGAVVLEVRGR